MTEPSSGPSNISFPKVSTSSILVTWSMPPEQDRNGIIQQYSVRYKSAENVHEIETTTDNTWFEVKSLKPYQNVQFHVKAATVVGFGPATIAYQRTLPSGMYTASTILIFSRSLTLIFGLMDYLVYFWLLNVRGKIYH